MIPKKYGIGGEAAVATYDYTDLADGVGFVIYQGYNSGLSGNALGYHLGTTEIQSREVETDMIMGETLTFDSSTFNLPRSMKGTAMVRFTSYWTGTAASFYNANVKIQKVDANAVVTTIGSASSLTISGFAVDTIDNNTIYMDVDEHFKKGDTLRLWFQDSRTAGSASLANDPANRAGRFVSGSAVGTAINPTKLEVHIPYKIDL